jgi:hypothetical protein
MSPASPAEEALWRELGVIVSEMDRVLENVRPEWRSTADCARFAVLVAKFNGVAAAIAMLQRREREEQ